ncbi:hypothetical protein JTM69_33955, partial [Pseudomonas aeruginosa]|nr:hypothetical protein [Pseudomonas aeruginosa]
MALQQIGLLIRHTMPLHKLSASSAQISRRKAGNSRSVEHRMLRTAPVCNGVGKTRYNEWGFAASRPGPVEPARD